MQTEPARGVGLDLPRMAAAVAQRPLDDLHVTTTEVPASAGSPATAGLWQVDVRDREGARRAFFVKLLRHPRLWPGLAMIPSAQRDEFLAQFPWRMELELHRAIGPDVLPPGLRTARVHHVEQLDPDHVVVWSEFIDDVAGPWPLEDYANAARALGRLAGRRREGAVVNERLPAAYQGGRLVGLRYYVERRVRFVDLPPIRARETWQHPFVVSAQACSGDQALREDLLDLAARIPETLAALEQLPQSHPHGDACPQNLLRPVDEPGTFAIVDWGFPTLHPVGFDLGQLLVGHLHSGVVHPSAIPAIDAAILPAYLDGLRAEGHEAREEEVRLGYLGSLALRSAFASLPFDRLHGPAPHDPAPDVRAHVDRRLRLVRGLLDLTAPHLPAGTR